ncbi:MAG: arylamine N-acetyltransferase [Arcobacteraceae bacterium]
MSNKEIVKNYLNTLEINEKIKSLEDITKLIKAHLRTFSFSSLRVLLKEDISLELSAIYDNIVVKRRGGYCFEHNKLMFEVLKELGFGVEYHLARVINNTENIPPQTHRFTLLEFEKQKYLIDVGIGFRTPSIPIKLGKEPSISHLGIEYKIVELEDKTFSMQLIEKGNIFNATKFDLKECYEVDFEMGNFYSHKNPNAIFVNNFVASRIEDNIIHSLFNNKYFKITTDITEEIEIKNSKQLEEILKNNLNSEFTVREVDFLYKQYVKKYEY